MLLSVLGIFCLCKSHPKDRRPHPDLDVLSNGSAASQPLCLSGRTRKGQSILCKELDKEPGPCCFCQV